jgi:hypothetical protein
MKRPKPPAGIGEFSGDYPVNFMPALDMPLWVRETFLDPSSKLFNQNHYHLEPQIELSVGFLWCASGFDSKGRYVIGQAEQLLFRCGKWQKWRQEQQMMSWFGINLPEYLITLDASYCAQCSDIEFCALVEHELHHIAHAKDKDGQPAFWRDSGLPKLCIRGHDVEEFIDVIARYGVGHKDSAVARLVQAGNSKPEIGIADIANACGTCLRLVA